MSSIEQIENLLLPKRGEERRVAYLSDRLHCLLQNKETSIDASIIDISPGGVGVLVAGEQTFSGKDTTLVFLKKKQQLFTVSVTITHKASVVYQEKRYLRVGLSFRHKEYKSNDIYMNSLGVKLFPIMHNIRPQIFWQDPFFFSENVLAQIVNISSKGLDVSCDAKTVVPSMLVSAKIFVPGHDLFEVTLSNSNLLYRGGVGVKRFFLQFKEENKALSQALAEYLLFFSKDISVKQLKDSGFYIGQLGHSLQVSYEKISKNLIEQKNLRPIGIAPQFLTTKSSSSRTTYRPLVCYLGQEIIAACCLNFSTNKETPEKNIIEWTDLHLSNHISLPEIFLFLLQHVIKVSHEANAHALIVSANESLLKPLESVGFVKSKNQKSTESPYTLLELPIAEIFSKKTIAPNVWKKVYAQIEAYSMAK